MLPERLLLENATIITKVNAHIKPCLVTLRDRILFMNEGKSSGISVNCDRLTYSKVVYIWKFWLESQRSAKYNTLSDLDQNAKPVQVQLKLLYSY